MSAVSNLFAAHLARGADHFYDYYQLKEPQPFYVAFHSAFPHAVLRRKSGPRLEEWRTRRFRIFDGPAEAIVDVSACIPALLEQLAALESDPWDVFVVYRPAPVSLEACRFAGYAGLAAGQYDLTWSLIENDQIPWFVSWEDVQRGRPIPYGRVNFPLAPLQSVPAGSTQRTGNPIEAVHNIARWLVERFGSIEAAAKVARKGPVEVRDAVQGSWTPWLYNAGACVEGWADVAKKFPELAGHAGLQAGGPTERWEEAHRELLTRLVRE